MTAQEPQIDIPSAADLVRLLDWTIAEALSLRHASEVTIRERRKLVSLLHEQVIRLARGWKRLSWRFEPDLVGSIGIIVQVVLPEYLDESDQVLAAAEMAGAFPDTERWRSLYEALSEELDKLRDGIQHDRRLSRELAKKAEVEIWPLLGFSSQTEYEESFSPSFESLIKGQMVEEKRLLEALRTADTISEADLLAQGFPREIIIDTISALSKSKLIKILEQNVFQLTAEGRAAIGNVIDASQDNEQSQTG